MLATFFPALPGDSNVFPMGSPAQVFRAALAVLDLVAMGLIWQSLSLEARKKGLTVGLGGYWCAAHPGWGGRVPLTGGGYVGVGLTGVPGLRSLGLGGPRVLDTPGPCRADVVH